MKSWVTVSFTLTSDQGVELIFLGLVYVNTLLAWWEFPRHLELGDT